MNEDLDDLDSSETSEEFLNVEDIEVLPPEYGPQTLILKNIDRRKTEKAEFLLAIAEDSNGNTLLRSFFLFPNRDNRGLKELGLSLNCWDEENNMCLLRSVVDGIAEGKTYEFHAHVIPNKNPEFGPTWENMTTIG